MKRFGGLQFDSDESDSAFEEVPFKRRLTNGQPNLVFSLPTLGPEKKTVEYVFTHMLVTQINKTDATWSKGSLSAISATSEKMQKVLYEFGLTDFGLVPLVEAIVAKQVSNNTLEATVVELKEMKMV